MDVFHQCAADIFDIVEIVLGDGLLVALAKTHADTTRACGDELGQIVRLDAADPSRRRPHSVAYAIQHMNRYCDSNLKLEDYAAMCCMSKYHFLRVFKQKTGEMSLEYRKNQEKK